MVVLLISRDWDEPVPGGARGRQCDGDARNRRAAAVPIAATSHVHMGAARRDDVADMASKRT